MAISESKIPIVLVTGFLGSGKTTLIKTFLKKNKGKKKVGILSNEIGDISIDGRILDEMPIEMFELNDGCICCSINENFKESLSLLASSGKVDLIIIETTGVANPMPILYSIYDSNVFVDLVIGVLDGINYKKVIQEPIFEEQIASSDIIVVTKLENENTLDAIQNYINPINSKASVKLKQQLDVSLLFNMTHKLESRLVAPQKSHSHDLSDIQTFTLSITEPLSIGTLNEKILSLTNIWRIKGVFRAKDQRGLFILNYAFGRFTIDDYTGQHQDTKFVFIGKDILSKKERINNILFT